MTYITAMLITSEWYFLMLIYGEFATLLNRNKRIQGANSALKHYVYLKNVGCR